MTTSLTDPGTLTDRQKQQVIQVTRQYLELVNRQYRINTSSLDLTFNLTGRAAGMYRVKRHNGSLIREIRYNTYIFARYFDDNLQNTVPHEVAHFVTDMLYGLSAIKPHGKEWKQVMKFFNADSSVTADYDLTGLPLRQQARYLYRCACREHELSATRHNRITRKRTHYYCNKCQQTLRPTESSMIS